MSYLDMLISARNNVTVRASFALDSLDYVLDQFIYHVEQYCWEVENFIDYDGTEHSRIVRETYIRRRSRHHSAYVAYRNVLINVFNVCPSDLDRLYHCIESNVKSVCS